MRFFPADPDISTIYNRIVDGDMDLQPDFQRGEVWSIGKQQRLIDSILRSWIVPPVLVVATADGARQEVLDGQQRLASILHFKQNKIKVDGRIEPISQELQQLHGLTYAELPPDIRRGFDKTTIRIFEVRDYSPDEPAEIFFRLNQPTVLTSAEKRNAFYGPVRTQIKSLVDDLSANEDAVQMLGFTNNRMAYDDVIARLACTLEFNTLHRKLTASAITDMYRRETPLDDEVYYRIKILLQSMSKVFSLVSSVTENSRTRIRLNKATALTWLLFVLRIDALGDVKKIADFLIHFELIRQSYGNDLTKDFHSSLRDLEEVPVLWGSLVLYNDRATARVSDVSSVLIRDFVLWLSWYEYSKGSSAQSFERSYHLIPKFLKLNALAPLEKLETEVLNFIYKYEWAERLQ